ncbi:bifunctional nuclease 2 [Helianthus annuus]|uniref:Putative wound-responsive family protein n=1 Tax=Helianthus annuus TaxID=4232 RepID=A0A251TWI4_HELAN|nr:bifunctional nuclease 2 [Helianthus annuus]
MHPRFYLTYTGISLCIMLRLQFCARIFTGDFSDHQTLFANHLRRSPFSISFSTSQLKHYRRRSLKPIVISCNYSRDRRSGDYDYEDSDDYLEAAVLMTETLLHHQMRIQGYQEVMKWQPTKNFFPLSGQGKGSRNIPTIGPELLSQFRSPTIFLKISCDCDGDYLLPIIVGEYAVEKLISSSLEDEGTPNHFQLVRNIVGKLGYEVKLVQITERVGNIYMANIRFHKPGKEDIRVDARPSDAINVAKRCRAPIYVSKQIVLADAIKIVYKTGKLPGRKPTYDVYLDSAIDGPDELSEELDLVTKMNLAVKEERYSDAAMWRDKLLDLRSPDK